MQVFLFFALIISILAVVFAVQNTEAVTVKFALWQVESSLALVLLVAVAAGSLISFFVSLPSNLRTRWALRQQRKKMTELETSLASLRGQLDEAQKVISEAKAPVQPPAPPASPAAPASPEIPSPAEIIPAPVEEHPAES